MTWGDAIIWALRLVGGIALALGAVFILVLLWKVFL